MNSSHSPDGHEPVGDAERLEVHLVPRRSRCRTRSRRRRRDRSRRGRRRPRRMRSGARRACGVIGASTYAGSSGLLESTCLMSMSSSSWCCCSWCRPSSIKRGELGPRSVVAAVDQLVHRAVDVRAVARDLLDRRPREQAALRTGMTRTDRLVVRVEEVPEVGIEGAYPASVRLEEERLEEPGRVTAVPLGRAHVGHRLNDLVLGTERSGERFREAADRVIASAQRFAVGDCGDGGHHRCCRSRPRPTRGCERERAIR